MVILALSFIVGTAFGSFVGVIAGRLHVAPIINSRSKCLSCSHMLSTKDMIPMVSCLLLRGKCRYCKVRFGYTHAIFEAVFGFLFAVVTAKYILPLHILSSHELMYLAFLLVTIVTLGVIFLYDLNHKIIPRVFLYLFLTLSLFPLISRFGVSHSYLELASPFIVALPYLLLFLITLGRGVGFGDVLLFAGVGAFVTLDEGIMVFLLSLWIGTLTVIPLLLLKKIKKDRAIPFAPFIIISFLLVLFTGWQVSELVTLIYRAML